MKELWAVLRPRKQRVTYYFRCDTLSHERMEIIAQQVCGSAVIPSIVGSHEVPVKLIPYQKIEGIQIFYPGIL